MSSGKVITNLFLVEIVINENLTMTCNWQKGIYACKSVSTKVKSYTDKVMSITCVDIAYVEDT